MNHSPNRQEASCKQPMKLLLTFIVIRKPSVTGRDTPQFQVLCTPGRHSFASSAQELFTWKLPQFGKLFALGRKKKKEKKNHLKCQSERAQCRLESIVAFIFEVSTLFRKSIFLDAISVASFTCEDCRNL